MACFAKIISMVAQEKLTEKTREMKKDYLSQHTWKLIQERQHALETEQWDVAKKLKNEIQSNARKDKETATLRELEEVDRDGYKWEGLKHMRKTFQLKRTRFKDKDGQIISESQVAEEAAKYLASEQWEHPSNQVEPDSADYKNHESIKFKEGLLSISDEEFSLEEVNSVIRKLKNKKAPRPDGCIGELIK